MARRGREEPPDLVAGQAPADPVAVAREIALRQLTLRARTRAELETAMRKRSVPEHAITEVLGRFTELGLVDDRAFAGQWVEGQQRRMRSRRGLRHELSAKGVDADTIAEALESVDDESEFEAALAFAQKRAAATRSVEPLARRRRILGALARRGFSSSVAHRAVAEALGESDE